MSDIIHLLPDSVANQIAAGEVIQRPASVIKELIENAVDAGAACIDIYIKDAGRTLIQVIDDGKGMSETDARMAFARHATSKINAAADLFSLSTMGFRGEALPSICAISQVELRTKTDADSLGTCLKINCSRVESQEPCVCKKGTNIMVRNIFCNLPARRKFLKSDNVELANIMREFERMALVNHNIHFTLDTGQKHIDLRPATFKQRIGDIWKNNLNLQLLPVEVDTSLVKISGFISRPEYARRRNPLQYLIVNGRNMRHPYFHKAIMSCFERLIAPDTQPCYFIRFDVDPATIDVNIHPTKNEIKFEYEQDIWRILSATVREALGKFGAVPSIDFNSETIPIAPVHKGEFIDSPKIEIDPAYNPFETHFSNHAESAGGSDRQHPGIDSRYKPTRISSDWNKLYSDFMDGVRDSDRQRAGLGGDDKELFHADTSSPADNPICMQVAMKYIVTSIAGSLTVIDQHRAHVRILYEEFLASAHNRTSVCQHVMFPETVTLDETQMLAYEAVEDELSRIGFSLSKDSTGNTLHINAVPAVTGSSDPKDMILRILDSVSDDSVNYGNEDNPAETMIRRVALVMARSAAITGGKSLSVTEMEHLVSRLMTLPDPTFTPNGNRIICTLDTDDLTGMFG